MPHVVGPLRLELARKTIHVTSSVIPITYAAGLSRARLLLLLALLGVVAVTVELARARSPRVRALFVGAVGALLREHEHRGWSGATWLLAAYALSVVLFPRDVAVAAMLAAGLGDAAAAVVGRSVVERWDRWPVNAIDDNVRVALAAGGAALLAQFVMSLAPRLR